MKNFIKQALGVFIAIFLIVLPIKTMFLPNNVAGAGVGGLAIIIKSAFGLDMALTALFVNSILLILGLILLGKAFFIKTFYGAMLVPFFMKIIPEIAISNDVILSVLFGSLLTAIAVNLLYYLDASSGGTTIPPMIFKKYFGLNQSIGLLISDALIVLLSVFVLGVESFMYSALVIILTAIIMESLSTNLSRKKVIYIISNQEEAIANSLFSTIGRGATRLQAKGVYSSNNINILMIVLNDRDLYLLQKIIDMHDKDAFLIVQDVAWVKGKAFTYHAKGDEVC